MQTRYELNPSFVSYERNTVHFGQFDTAPRSQAVLHRDWVSENKDVRSPVPNSHDSMQTLLIVKTDKHVPLHTSLVVWR